ncbi:MAG TPA: gluconeogenesis factor YvcK family protein [Candidatus Saccharimonadales bacterium]|nr:gluconeogenesis factor YvcK family protein [Candidatus Saccharimonadales bacterium]
MSEEKLGARIVVIGGGTGSFTLLSGLKHYARNITALVNMADDGGSTGHLRDELGVLPPGDVRQCLVALSDNPRVRDLFNYRFDEGSMKGHAFGNLFLTALEKMTGNFGQAVELAGQVLNITGRVEPVTLSNVTLCAEGADGDLKGEFKIAHAPLKSHPKIWLEPTAKANPAALEAIAEADLVVIAPGSLYGSLAPALVVDGIGQALKDTKAKRIYVSNLVTKPGQTEGFDVNDFADEIERLAGGPFLDYVIYNTLTPPKDLMDKYAHEGEYLVELDAAKSKDVRYRLSGRPILAKGGWGEAQAADEIAASRSFIRHDSEAVARAIMRLYFD